MIWIDEPSICSNKKTNFIDTRVPSKQKIAENWKSERIWFFHASHILRHLSLNYTICTSTFSWTKLFAKHLFWLDSFRKLNSTGFILSDNRNIISDYICLHFQRNFFRSEWTRLIEVLSKFWFGRWKIRYVYLSLVLLQSKKKQKLYKYSHNTLCDNFDWLWCCKAALQVQMDKRVG